MNNKLVSIVLPTFNRAPLLKKAIKSCLNQTHKNIELIVVNDGSTDKTESVVEKFIKSDPRIRYFRKENGGLPNALNFGFKKTKGEFLTWTSDDNQYKENAIEEMANYLIKHPKTHMVNANMTVIRRGEVYCEKDMSEIERMSEYNTIGACFLYRRGVYEKIGDYNEDFILAEDYDYWIRVWKSFKIGHINKSLYLYGLEDDTLTIRENAKIQIATALLRYVHGFATINDLANFIINSMEKGSNIPIGCLKEVRRSIKEIIKDMYKQKLKSFVVFGLLYQISKLTETYITQFTKEKNELYEEKNKLNEELVGLKNSTSYKLGCRILGPWKKYLDLKNLRMATIQEKAKSLGKSLMIRLKNIFRISPRVKDDQLIAKPNPVKAKKLVLEIRYGGLGDHLYWSHLPRIAKEQGVKKVYVSNSSEYRNPIYKKLFWENNPYVDGFTDKNGFYPIFTTVDKGTNILDRVMLEQGLDDGKRFHEPEIYFKPKIKPELKDKTLYDPNYVSNAGDTIQSKAIENYFRKNNIKVDYQMKLRDKNVPVASIKKVLEAKDIEDFISIIASCKEIYCLASGTATLASALNKKTTVFYADNLSPIFLHSKKHKYILIK